MAWPVLGHFKTADLVEQAQHSAGIVCMPQTKPQGFNSSSYVKRHEPIVLWNWCLLQILSLPSKHSSYLCELWNVCDLSAVQETDLL